MGLRSIISILKTSLSILKWLKQKPPQNTIQPPNASLLDLRTSSNHHQQAQHKPPNLNIQLLHLTIQHIKIIIECYWLNFFFLSSLNSLLFFMYSVKAMKNWVFLIFWHVMPYLCTATKKKEKDVQYNTDECNIAASTKWNLISIHAHFSSSVDALKD